jgi:hypothetical protein
MTETGLNPGSVLEHRNLGNFRESGRATKLYGRRFTLSTDHRSDAVKSPVEVVTLVIERHTAETRPASGQR